MLSTRTTQQSVVPLARTCCLLVVTLWTAAPAGAAESIAAHGERRAWPSRTLRKSDVAKHPFPETDTIRLNYWSASWKTVLDDVAKGAGAKLVAPELPDGRYSRRDGKTHSLTEAVRILNSSLESQGYRILVKPPYLILVELGSTRPRYQPATIPANRQVASDALGATRRFPEPTSIRRLPPVEASSRDNRYPVRPASYTGQPDRLSPSAADPIRQPRTRMRLRIQHQEAGQVASRMAEACEPGVVSLPSRPGESQSFRVGFPATGGKAGDSTNDGASAANLAMPRDLLPDREFAIAVDDQNNDLLIDAPPDLATAAAKLVRRLEAFAGRAGETIRVVPTGCDPRQVVQSLRVPLQRLLAAQVDVRSPRSPAAQPVAGADQQDNASAAAESRAEPESDLRALIAGLKEEVSVEALEDLGVMVVSGNPDDVAAVVKMIREIERLGVGAAPEVHLLVLKHINSESLAELLAGVYERLGALAGPASAGQGVSVMPVVKPNAVLIVASQADMPSILELADVLDQPADPRSQFQVFHLKYAAAAQVLILLEKLYEQRAGLAARIETVVDERTNSIVARGSPSDLAEVAALIKRIDLDESQSVSQMKLFPLKNAVAEELADVITTAIESVLSFGVGGSSRPGRGSQSSAGQPGDAAKRKQFETAKSVVLQFLTTEDGTQRAVRSGILGDIRVNFDARMNSLVVTAPRQSMQLMAELIRQLDEPTPVVADIKVFSMANADAAAMVRLLEALYQTQGQLTGSGVQVAGGGGVGSQLIPLRLSIDVRTNSIIVKGAPETLQVVEAILLRLDQSDLRQRQSTVYRLRNSPAEDVAKAINQFLSSQQDLAQIDPNLISTAEVLEREVIVVPEPVSNSLLISSTPRYYEEILELTKKLDDAPSQVIIQALLVEVELDNDDEFGVELGVQSSVLFDRSLVGDIVKLTETTTQLSTQTTTESVISQEATPGFLFNVPNLGNNVASARAQPSTVGGQGLSNFNVGRTNNDLGYGGLVLSAGSESLNVLIRALSTRRNIHVLSRPQIRTLDNQLAQIQVGQQVPIVDGVNVSDEGNMSYLVRQEQSGIILTVTPRISPEGIIVMEVIAEKSKFDLLGAILYTNVETGTVVRSPVKDIATARTTVSVPHGQTIVLGGMITDADDVTERKVPFLGDIPLLRHMFRYESSVKRRTELLIFLTPRIIHCDADSEMMKQVEAGRIHFCEQKAEEVHGPLFGIPEPHFVPHDAPQPPGAGPQFEPSQPLELLSPPEPSFDE